MLAGAKYQIANYYTKSLLPQPFGILSAKSLDWLISTTLQLV
jgi:hypothetical protein